MPSALLALVLAAGPVKVASPAWNVVDIKPELASFYEEQLAQALRSEGLEVKTARDISTLLGAERQRELLGCSTIENSCLAELANALGCEFTLTVSLARLGTSFRGLAKMMSSRDASVISSVKIEATNEAQLADKLEAAAKALAKPLVKAPTAVESDPKVPKDDATAAPAVTAPGPTRRVPTLWWLPGALGVVAAGIGGTMIGLAGGKHADLSTKSIDSNTAAEWVNQGEGLQTMGWLVAGPGLAAIAGSVLWLVLGTTEVQPTVAIGAGQALLLVGGRF